MYRLVSSQGKGNTASRMRTSSKGSSDIPPSGQNRNYSSTNIVPDTSLTNTETRPTYRIFSPTCPPLRKEGVERRRNLPPGLRGLPLWVGMMSAPTLHHQPRTALSSSPLISPLTNTLLLGLLSYNHFPIAPFLCHFLKVSFPIAPFLVPQFDSKLFQITPF